MQKEIQPHFLKTKLYKEIPHLLLFIGSHGLDERLVPISEVDAAPTGC